MKDRAGVTLSPVHLCPDLLPGLSLWSTQHHFIVERKELEEHFQNPMVVFRFNLHRMQWGFPELSRPIVPDGTVWK